MANTYTLIASNTLSSSAASVTFSSIPATYTDLVLRISARSTYAGTYSQGYVRPNNLAYNPSSTELVGTGTSATSTRAGLGAQFGWDFAIPGATNTSNTFGSMECYMPNYNVVQKKPASLFSVSEGNTATIYETWIEVVAGLNADSTAAITSVYIYDDYAQFASGSSFFLYGIKNS